MLYEIRHRTTYDYDYDVSLSHHILRLTTRELPGQHCQRHVIETIPVATTRSTHLDHFGNTTTFLTFEGPHRRLEIAAVSRVEVARSPAVSPDETPPWKTIRDGFVDRPAGLTKEAAEFIFESPLVPRRPAFADYARECFPPGRPVLQGAGHLAARIHSDFKFDSAATSVTTPVGEFFKIRRGVCQDFAHLMISCLRSLDLPARYVSGYLETEPPPGQVRLAGSDASHAWVSLWCGECGWIDLDPTNNLLPTDRHITIAWGRDFSDVSPVRGIVVGSGQHKLRVAVDVAPRL